MKTRVSARSRVAQKPLTADLVHSVARKVFPKKNDYVRDAALFEELLPELRHLGIETQGELKSLLTTHRKALLKDDRSRLAPWEIRHYCEMYDAAFVQDAVRRHY